MLWIENHPNNEGQPPGCVVSVINTSTNAYPSHIDLIKMINCYWNAYSTNYLRIELLDSKGDPIKKTAIGKQYTASSDSRQLKELYDKLDRRLRVRGFVWIDPSSSITFARFNIPELFELKEPGEYTLRVQMRLIQNIRSPQNAEFKTTWLPEVTAKIQIRSGDSPK